MIEIFGSQLTCRCKHRCRVESETRNSIPGFQDPQPSVATQQHFQAFQIHGVYVMHSGKIVIRTRQCVAFISNAAEIGWVSSKLPEKDFKDKSSIYQQNFKQIHIKSIQSMPIEQHIIRETVIVVWTYSTSTEEFYSVSHVV